MLSMFFAPETKEAAKAAVGQAAAAAPAPASLPKLPPLETEHSWAMPTQASTFAESTDNLYFFITALSVFFFILIIGAMVYFMKKYARRSEDQKTSSITHNGKIEFLWSAIPAVLLVVIFAWGEIDWIKQTTPPSDAIDIRVTGQQWTWKVDYPDYPGVFLTSAMDEPLVTMMVPKGKPVRLIMTSEDVLHSFFVPAFRVKKDLVPGRYTTLWFEATTVGEFNLFCAEYCGDRHSSMGGVVKVLEPEQFEAALREAAKLEQKPQESVKDFGGRIYKRRGCDACHKLDDSPGNGPSWKNLYGKKETLSGGEVITVDDDYIRESVLTPRAKVVAGFENVNMPSYQGQLDDKQITALIEFIKAQK
jgi:cytochrome c oxidase subunit 2